MIYPNSVFWSAWQIQIKLKKNYFTDGRRRVIRISRLYEEYTHTHTHTVYNIYTLNDHIILLLSV